MMLFPDGGSWRPSSSALGREKIGDQQREGLDRERGTEEAR